MILKVQDLSHRYERRVDLTLKNVSFSVPPRSMLGIIGSSGSGKSTMMRCINGLETLNGGTIEFQNEPIQNLRGSDLRRVRSHMGMIFQNFCLVPYASVLTNVLLGKTGIWQNRFLGGLFSKWPQEWIQEAHQALERVGLAERVHDSVQHLSGGQQQRVAIARCILQKPELLLADEPVASLDPISSRMVFEYLVALNQEYGMTVLCNVHSLEYLRTYFPTCLALKKGKLLYQGPTAELSESMIREIYET